MKPVLLTLFFSAFFSAFATVYKVGPGKTYLNISDVPLEDLQAGDTVLIHYRPSPYQEKFVISGAGTESEPIVVKGVPSAEGDLPVISGDGAVTRTALSFWSETRGIVKVGGASVPADNPSYVVVEYLDIQNCGTGYFFTDDAGVQQEYSDNAAAIYAENGSNITIRGCRLSNCGNGLFVAYASSNVLVEKNEIFDNGVEGSIYEHNAYTEAQGITFQFNHFKPLRSGCPGNNLKDRSAGTIIRYNIIEGGNRQLDLVESDHSELLNHPQYHQTLVYGNLLVEPGNDGNSQICHYGGDNGDASTYRKGTLYFYNNTIISHRTGNTTLLRLSTDDESADLRNNVIYASIGGNYLAIIDNSGSADLYNNWLNSGWKVSHSNASADVTAVSGNLTGTDPGFLDPGNGDYTPAESSPLLNSGGSLHPNVSNYPPFYEPDQDERSGFSDIGAFSAQTVTSVHTEAGNNLHIAPNPFSADACITGFNEGIPGRVSILNSGGGVIFNSVIQGKKQIRVSELVTELSPGVYFILIRQGDEVSTGKLVKY